MSEHAMASFQVKSWDEKPFHEGDGLPKLTRASVSETLSGDIEGEGTIEYLMAYREDGSATFVGMLRVVGRLDGRSGSFVLLTTGTFEVASGVAKGSLTVVPGSSTGELAGLAGEGSFEATHEPPGEITLDFDLQGDGRGDR